MSIQPNYDGPCLVRIAIPGVSSGALMDVGYSEDGISPSFNPAMLNVHGDQNGGSNGTPIDIQMFGEIATVRIVFTSFDYTAANYIAQRTANAAANNVVGKPDTTVGRLLFTEAQTMRLLLSPTSRPMNFPRAVPRGVISPDPKGTKFQRWTCEFTCYKDSNGVLYNSTTG